MTEAGTNIFVFSRMLVFHEVKLQEKPRLARGIINLATFFLVRVQQLSVLLYIAAYLYTMLETHMCCLNYR